MLSLYLYRQRNCLVGMNFICPGLLPLPPPPCCHFVPPHLPHTFKQRLPTSQIFNNQSLHNRNLEPSTHRHLLQSECFLPSLVGREVGRGSSRPQGSSMFFPQHQEANGPSRGFQTSSHPQWAWPEWGATLQGM